MSINKIFYSRSHTLRGNAQPGRSRVQSHFAGASSYTFPRGSFWNPASSGTGTSLCGGRNRHPASSGTGTSLCGEAGERGGQQNGFTLIEVLVAMFVLALGLLGLAGLQAHALKNNQSAYYRSQATQLAYDMADRMRANLAEAQQFGASQYDSDVLAPTAATNQADCKTTTGCTPAQMAQQDLFDWNKNLQDWLPGGTASINASTSFFTITINWDDNHDGTTDNNDPNFTMTFEL